MLLESGVQIVGVALMVLPMVDLHRTCVDVRLQGVMVISQCGQFERISHRYLSYGSADGFMGRPVAAMASWSDSEPDCTVLGFHFANKWETR